MRSDRIVASLVIVLAVGIARTAGAAPDPMAEYRERFRTGLARYQAGAIAEAIQYWEPVYRELGPDRGWRLAFNLARAYEKLGDFTRAVERYESFVAQVARRRESGEAMEELIVREEEETRERLAAIAASRGRIVVTPVATPIAVKIDGSEPRLAGFTAYVAPGTHVVVFDPGSQREARREIVVAAGERVELVPPALEPRVAPAEPAPVDVPKPAPEPSPPPKTVRVVERPFSSVVLWAFGGAAVASTIVPILTYQSASDYRAQKNGTPPDPRATDEYDARRTTAYVTLAIPITLAAGTAALAGWYFFGTRERDVPQVVATPDGAFATWQRVF